MTTVACALLAILVRQVLSVKNVGIKVRCGCCILRNAITPRGRRQ